MDRMKDDETRLSGLDPMEFLIIGYISVKRS